jgi:signal transduction histidine kinase
MLDRIERLVAAQQRFAANAAHQLRTPLAVQRAAAEIGLAGDPEPLTVARIRRKMIENTEDSERLIEGLLLLATSDEGITHREPIELDDVVSEAVRTLIPEAHRQKITLDVETGSASIDGDAILVGQLVHNLVSNALIHNHPGGAVRVRVTGPGVVSAAPRTNGANPVGVSNSDQAPVTVRPEAVSPSPDVGLGVGVVNPGPVVEVVNTGPIVPVESVANLFEPFHGARQRRYAPGQGAGLGLSIVASIARAHAATVNATPNPLGGLTVRVAFPKPPDPRPADLEQGDPRMADGRAGKATLVNGLQAGAGRKWIGR